MTKKRKIMYMGCNDNKMWGKDGFNESHLKNFKMGVDGKILEF